MAENTEAGQGGAGEGAATGGTGAAANTGAASGTTGQGTSGQAAQTGAAPSGFTYQEDRSKWIPDHRFKEVNTKYTEAQGKVTSYEGENARLKAQLAAANGFTPADPNAAKTDQIKAAMFEMFPWAKRISDLSQEEQEQLFNAPSQAEQANQFVSQQWQKHARTLVSSLHQEVASVLGVETLSDKAKSSLTAAFKAEINADYEIAKRTGEISPVLQQYLDGDQSVVQNFAKSWATDFGIPARRQNVAQQLNNQPRVPGSGGRTQQTSVIQPLPANATMDQRMDRAAELYKERGGQFGQ